MNTEEDIRLSLNLHDEAATVETGVRLGKLLANTAVENTVLFLEGQLGAGKTTLTRGVLSSLGHSGAVKSPTYTLVEPYESLAIPVYHFDLYRLGDPEELEYMGIRDYFDSKAIVIIEWPNKGTGFLPAVDIRLSLAPQRIKSEQTIITGRQLTLVASTERGKRVLANW